MLRSLRILFIPFRKTSSFLTLNSSFVFTFCSQKRRSISRSFSHFVSEISTNERTNRTGSNVNLNANPAFRFQFTNAAVDDVLRNATGADLRHRQIHRA